MGKLTFPWLAMGMGLLLATGLVASGALSPDANYDLPLLTMMIVNEFGFFVTAIGAGLGINALLREGVQPSLLMVTVVCPPCWRISGRMSGVLGKKFGRK